MSYKSSHASDAADFFCAPNMHERCSIFQSKHEFEEIRSRSPTNICSALVLSQIHIA